MDEFPFDHHHHHHHQQEAPPPAHHHHHHHQGGPPLQYYPPPQHISHEVNPYPHPQPPQIHVQHISHEQNRNIHIPSFIHHHPHIPEAGSEFSSKPSVRVFCKADTGYSLTIRDHRVILARSDPNDVFQHWIKDEKYSTRVKDEQGFPSFALVNKASGQAIKHSIGHTHPVQLITHNADKFDESILWTESNDLGDGYRTIRMLNNIRLNLDAFNGDRTMEVCMMARLLCSGNGRKVTINDGRLLPIDICQAELPKLLPRNMEGWFVVSLLFYSFLYWLCGD